MSMIDKVCKLNVKYINMIRSKNVIVITGIENK